MTRREVCNESGFGSAVPETGKEVKPLSSSIWDTREDIVLSTSSEPVTVFHERQIIALGGYIRSPEPLAVELNLENEVREFNLPENIWTPIGIHAEQTANDVTATIKSKKDVVCEAVGLTLSPLDEDIFTEGVTYDDGKTVRDVFETRTYGCVPYIYYLDHEKTRTGDGSTVMLKSCNRCGRFLPVEKKPSREKNSPSFSNHSRMTEITCVTGKYEGETAELTHGYQLECKACKKFYVNAALNHKRSTAQRREDALRRREVEKLVQQENPYKKFRAEYGMELDEYILEQFDGECFNCNKPLDSTDEMHIDHTMPLSYLWPLDETATALCPMCNSAKSDSFPVDFYNDSQLVELSRITGLSLDVLESKCCNPEMVDEVTPVCELAVSDKTKKSIHRRLDNDRKI